MTKLTETQTTILSAGSQRPDNIALPLPKGLAGAAAKMAVTKMIERGWLQEIDANLCCGEPLWRETGDGHGTTLIVTDAGLLAIGIEPVVAKTEVTIHENAAETPVPKLPTPRAGTKQAMLITLLRAHEDATMDEIVAATGWLDRQTLRDWVHRYNTEGLGGLENRKGTHRPLRLVLEQLAKLAAWVEAGPDPVRDGVVRWRRRDLQARIAAEFGVELHERAVGKQLAALGFRRLQVAPAAPEIGRASTSGVQKNFREAVAAAIPETAQAKPLEIWFQGEPDQKTVRGTVFPANAHVGQQGTLTRVWAKRGTRPRAKRDTRYQWSYIFGAVCPGRAVAAGLVLPFANTEAMNAHLTEIARTVAEGAHAILVLDGAGSTERDGTGPGRSPCRTTFRCSPYRPIHLN